MYEEITVIPPLYSYTIDDPRLLTIVPRSVIDRLIQIDAAGSAPIVLTGPTGAGKSFLAAAWLRMTAIRGDGVHEMWRRFMPARDLDHEEAVGHAIQADALVLDTLDFYAPSLVTEMQLAHGLLDMHKAAVRTILETRANRGAKTLVTTTLTPQQMLDLHGEDVHRFLYSSPERVIQLRPIRHN